MQESIGGALVFKIAMVFIIIFIALLAIAVKYSAAFVLKNNIVNIIEQCEGADNDCYNQKMTELKNNYHIDETSNLAPDIERQGSKCYANAGLYGVYYNVTTKVDFSLPFMNGFVIPVKGKTKVIYDLGGEGC